MTTWETSGSNPRAASRRRTPDGGMVIAHIAGAPVVISPTSLVLAALVAGSWLPFVRSTVGHEGIAAMAITLAITVVGAALSILAHELMHGLAGTVLGRRPRMYELYLWGGRTSFGPAVGWKPWKDVVTSLAGPATNALLWLACRWALEAFAYAIPLSVAVGLWALGWFNMVVAIFNALPGLPLDGGHALAAAVAQISGRERLGQRVAAWGGFVVVGLAAWWWVVRPVILWGRRPDGLTLIFLVLVAWPLVTTSWRVLGLGRSARAEANLDLRALAHPIASVAAQANLAQVRSVLQSGAALVLVVDGTALVGIIDAVALTELGHIDETTVLASQVCTVLPPAAVTTSVSGAGAAQALRQAREISRWLVVVEGGRMCGAVPTGAR